MCLMARCITYFTMLVELLIIKNVKSVGGVINWVQVTYSRWILQSINFSTYLKAFALFRKSKTCICSAAEMGSLPLVLFIIIKSQLTY